MQLHVQTEGEMNPTVVFDCGLGVSLASSDWSLIHPEITKVSRTIVYDRAGLGLSDKSSKPRTSEQIVEELHALLVNTEEKPPYILVGHSLGALNVCLFANKYPEKVAGVVLVDGGSVNFYKDYFKTPILYFVNYVFELLKLISYPSFWFSATYFSTTINLFTNSSFESCIYLFWAVFTSKYLLKMLHQM